MKAADIMTKSVVSVDPDLPVAEVAKFMLGRKVSAVPVVDRGSRLIGMVSEGDLMRRSELATDKQRSWWLRMFIGDDYLAREFVRFHGHKARDVMTRKVVTVGESTPIQEIVTLLEENQIKRVPVVRDDHVVGIVSRADLLRAFASQATQEAAKISDSDRDIQSRILAELERQPWWHERNCGIVVSDGIAHLWGTTESPEQREALRVVAESAAGVRGVKNHVNVVRPMVLYSS
jgi:CBS domain-containing protein